MAEEIKTPETEESGKNFILNFIDEDIAEGGQFQGMTVHTRFPPEPNGYLHIGHCKALTIDFGTAEKYNGLCNLRMDDTNPTKEDEEFVEAIKQDIHWLGFDWGDRFFYGSDYFEEDYRQAVLLIKKGLAYVCQLTPEEFKANRGDIGIPAVSPYRDRPIEESLDLFARMRAGEFPNGAMTLRAKIDLTSGNFNMRDPVIYRINHMSHHRQGDKWCIYPMYDFAHPIQDALEGITHSLCSLEFEAHRPLYNWVIEHCELPARPRQIEFARLGIDHTVMSKRKLRKLVEENYVSGWDDPRMPTLCGLRRRGYTAASIRNFCERIGVAKSPNVIEYGFLEHCLREDLNANAERTMAVLHPVKLTVTNYPEGQSETFTVENNPTDPTQGTHDITFSRHLWIEEDDFMEVPVPKYKRLTPNGPECRLKGAYLVTCTGCVKDENGCVTEVLCTYDPDSRGGDPADGRKVKGATLHWVDAENCMDAEVRLYDNLFSDATPDGPDKDFLDCLNPESLTVLRGCKVEPEMAAVAAAFDKKEGRTGVNAPTFQFMRVGYFCLDNRDSTAEHLVFNRSVSLKDSFKK
ncbi:MAG: glutamine--tRNA ligase [Firmicutes bacterium CAG:176_63_11]|nr:MAG: glutamine--tRNA ligase [Firmicutes bacterium CAG:176_63_11]